ncbi:MAG: squalene/phytoene synthase family protein [Gammaproteobacteria bacterium]|nr:squalene/phytoene synthase family protein [Gammaproteobacteria bacterium]
MLGRQLRGVSRSFYLTLRALPDAMREPVGIAYLLARAADTIADTATLPAEQRLADLQQLKAAIVDGRCTDSLLAIAERARGVLDHPAEQRLLDSLPQLLRLYHQSSAQQRHLIEKVTSTLIAGMEQDLQTFSTTTAEQPGALREAQQLDHYTYLVAGCVGEFWTDIAVTHEPALKVWNADKYAAWGISFGKALQLTNVLRDVAKDLRCGRCYLPEQQLEQAGLTPQDLLRVETGTVARPLLVEWTKRALDYYEDAEEYVLGIPRQCYRLRLASLWPLLIGLSTLEQLLRHDAWLDPDKPAKVSRHWIYRMIALSSVAVCSDFLLRRWIYALRRNVQLAL